MAKARLLAAGPKEEGRPPVPCWHELNAGPRRPARTDARRDSGCLVPFRGASTAARWFAQVPAGALGVQPVSRGAR